MKLFKKIFGKNKQINSEQSVYTIEEKLQHKVYPRIKNTVSQNFDIVYHKPLGGDLTLTFIQDINDTIVYIQKSEVDQLKHLIDEWRNNISEVEYDLFTTEGWNGLIYFNEPGDYSNEKIFDLKFIDAVCDKLNTDKVIFSISRRHRMQVTNYYNDFKDNESFFWSHFQVWRDSELSDEVLTEYILVGEKNKGILNIAHLGFRMNMYEKEGQYLLSYSVYDDGDNHFGENTNFSEIIERRKEKFTYE